MLYKPWLSFSYKGGEAAAARQDAEQREQEQHGEDLEQGAADTHCQEERGAADTHCQEEQGAADIHCQVEDDEDHVQIHVNDQQPLI